MPPHLCEYSFAAEAISNSLIVLQVIRLNFSLWINYSEEVKKQAEHVISTNEKTLLTSLNYTTYKLIDEIIVTLWPLTLHTVHDLGVNDMLFGK